MQSCSCIANLLTLLLTEMDLILPAFTVANHDAAKVKRTISAYWRVKLKSL